MKDLVSDGFAQVVKPYIDAQDKTTRKILAPVETDETDASRDYQIGDQLILGGILYDVIAPISQHGIITSTGSGANIEEADNITKQINLVNSALTNLDAEVTSVVNILGAKNLCPNNATSRVVSNVTFTVNTNTSSDEYGVVTASGTASANAQLEIVASLKVDTTCILSGCPSGGGDSSYLLVAFDGTNYFSDSGNGVTLPSGTYRIYILIYSGASINDKFYPMIRPASVADDTYVPYAATNRDLTNSLINSFPSIAPSETTWIDAYGGKMSAEIDLTARYPNMKRIIGACASGSAGLTTFPYMVLVTAPTKIRIWALNNNFTAIQAFITYSTI